MLLKDVARPRLSQNCLSRQVCRAGQVSLMERDLPGTASTNRDRISMEMVGQLDVVRQTTPPQSKVQLLNTTMVTTMVTTSGLQT